MAVTDVQHTSLDAVQFLDALEQTEVNWLHERGVARRFDRGSALFHERQLSDRVMILLDGRVKIASVSDDGREAVLAFRGPGEVLGELSAIDGQPRSASVIAVDPVRALVIPAADIREVHIATSGAQWRFVRGEDGWRVTFLGADTPFDTIQRTARDLDPALVVHFYGNKQDLFRQVMALPPAIADALERIADGPRETVGRRLAELIVGALENPASRTVVIGRIRSATTHPDAAALVRETVTRDLHALAATLTDDQPDTRAVLAGKALEVEALAVRDRRQHPAHGGEVCRRQLRHAGQRLIEARQQLALGVERLMRRAGAADGGDVDGGAAVGRAQGFEMAEPLRARDEAGVGDGVGGAREQVGEPDRLAQRAWEDDQ